MDQQRSAPAQQELFGAWHETTPRRQAVYEPADRSALRQRMPQLSKRQRPRTALPVG